MITTFSRLLAATAPPPASANVTEYLAHVDAAPRARTTVERAALAGSLADRLGFAFAGGYLAALERLLPGDGRACLLATETGGGHPRAIQTSLAPNGSGGFSLTGTKTFATLARLADTFLVVASIGEKEGKNSLRVVRVPATRAGVELTDLPPTPFAPELPHTTARFDDMAVEADEVLHGDGYDEYLKPFRTIEDVHVMAAVIGYVLRTGLAYGFGRATLEELFGHLAALVALGAAPPLERGVHVALAGVLAGLRATLGDASAHWAAAPDEVQKRWLRDSPLLNVADRVRGARTEAAWGRAR